MISLEYWKVDGWNMNEQKNIKNKLFLLLFGLCKEEKE